MATAWRSGPLSVGAFRLLTAGQFASTVGDYCYAVALPWLVLSNHGSTVLLGTLLACYGVPRMVLIPVGGVLADKLGPRTTMLAADTLRCACVAVLAVLAADHTASLAALGPIAALTRAGEGLFIPASLSMLPSLLDPGRLAAGTALFTAGQQAGSLIGRRSAERWSPSPVRLRRSPSTRRHSRCRRLPWPSYRAAAERRSARPPTLASSLASSLAR